MRDISPRHLASEEQHARLQDLNQKLYHARTRATARIASLGDIDAAEMTVPEATIVEDTLQRIGLDSLEAEAPSICIVVVDDDADRLVGAVRTALTQIHPRAALEILMITDTPEGEPHQEGWLTHPQVRRLPRQARAFEDPLEVVRWAARNTSCEWITLLDSRDTLEPGFVAALAEQARPGIDLVVGAISRFDPFLEDTDRHGAANDALRALGPGPLTDHRTALPLFETAFGKLFRTTWIGSAPPMSPSGIADIDLACWALLASTMSGSIALASSQGFVTYRWTARNESLQAQDVTTRASRLIATLEDLERTFFDGSKAWEHKALSVAAAHELGRLLAGILDEDPDATTRVRERALASESPLMNRSLLSKRPAIAFTMAFPPYSNAASINAAKRLPQIDAMEHGSLDWRVVRADMGTRYATDDRFQVAYSDFKVSHVDVGGSAPYWHEASQLAWGQQAAAFSEDMTAEVIYSRSMQPGSHVAAYRYKQSHPDVHWYAEFSDPIHMTSAGSPRATVKTYQGDLALLNDFWRLVELLVYRFADTIIFTNHHQMPYMLDHACPEDLRPEVEAKSIMLPHPQLDPRYVDVDPAPYPLDGRAVNVGYFGTFYEGPRTDETIGRMLSSPGVHLHLFSPKHPHIDRLRAHHPGRIVRHDPLPYLSFLNVASRMDFLLLLHRPFPGEKDPYITSKWRDYELAGRPIVSETPANSALLELPIAERLITVDDFLRAISERTSDGVTVMHFPDPASDEVVAGLMNAFEIDRDPGVEGATAILEALVERYHSLIESIDSWPGEEQPVEHVGKLRRWFKREPQDETPHTSAQPAAVAKHSAGTTPRPSDPLQKSTSDAIPPAVTALMATYRPTPFIHEAIESFLGQDYPPDRLRVLVSANGPDTQWVRELREHYAHEPRVTILHTAKPGIGAADNHALPHVDTPWFLKLDDDDLLSPGYVADLAQYVAPDLDLVLGRLEDMSEDGRAFVRDTYLTRTIEEAARTGSESLPYHDPAIASHFSALTAKLMRTSAYRTLGPRAEDVSHAGDILFWADNAHLLPGRVGFVSPTSPEAYYRRLTPTSVSRPSAADAYRYSVTDRIALIERLSRHIIEGKRPCKDMVRVARTILTQNQYMRDYRSKQDEGARKAIDREVRASDNAFLNRSWFSTAKGTIVAGAPLGEPSHDPMEVVLRIRDIEQLLDEPTSWHLIAVAPDPLPWRATALQSLLLPFIVGSQSFVQVPVTPPEGGLEPHITSRVLESEAPHLLMTMGALPDVHATGLQLKLVEPQARWVVALPSGVNDLAPWADVIAAADHVVVESDELDVAVTAALPPDSTTTVSVVPPAAAPEWLTRFEASDESC